MKKCPKCQKWLMVYDPYFERYRCPNAQCQYMPPSAVERAINRMENPEGIQRLFKQGHIEAYYDKVTDALIVNWNDVEPTIELPEPDGRLIWKIARDSHKVIGFELLGMIKWEINRIDIDFYRPRMEILEYIISDLFRNQRLDSILPSSLIERIDVRAHQSIAQTAENHIRSITINFSEIFELAQRKIEEAKELQQI